MKSSRWMRARACMTIMLIVGTTQAGSLTPPGPPESTMHTLTEIYEVVDELQQQVVDMQQQLIAMRLRQGADGMAENVGGMVLIPAGPFLMGDAFGEGDADEFPVHTVTVSAFYMDPYPVTKARWDEVADWAETKGYTDLPDGLSKGPSHPVHTVSWYDCLKWANACSQRDGLTPVYYADSGFTTVYQTGDAVPYADWSANGYRLPTEAEWEKAARGGAAGRRYSWADGNTITQTRANYFALPNNYDYDVNPTSGPHPSYSSGVPTPYTNPVGAFSANGYGLYDMTGNIGEWCWDYYSSSYYDSSPGTDPRGPADAVRRVRRGGSWAHEANLCRVADRNILLPGSVYDGLGFRLVRKAP